MPDYTQLTDNSGAVLSQLDSLTKRVVDKIGFDIERRAKENIVIMEAVDTGNMLNSAAYLPGAGAEGEMTVAAEYSLWVHDGYELPNGRFVPGRPFLRKAVIEVVADLPKEASVTIEWKESG